MTRLPERNGKKSEFDTDAVISIKGGRFVDIRLSEERNG